MTSFLMACGLSTLLAFGFEALTGCKVCGGAIGPSTLLLGMVLIGGAHAVQVLRCTQVMAAVQRIERRPSQREDR
ncbi:MAG: hypothetical protein ACFB9M_15190 [Myxococcota bacterium]